MRTARCLDSPTSYTPVEQVYSPVEQVTAQDILDTMEEAKVALEEG